MWRYSRHPNYFGEICFWWGIYIYTFDISFSLPIGAFLVTLMMLFGSVPMMENYIQKGPKAKKYFLYK